MTYSPDQRLRRILELAESDVECIGSASELAPALALLEEYTNQLPKEISTILWALPSALDTHYHRLLELICREMRFPEEL